MLNKRMVAATGFRPHSELNRASKSAGERRKSSGEWFGRFRLRAQSIKLACVGKRAIIRAQFIKQLSLTRK